ncbi:type IV pilus biogenesis protein PilO [Psychromonas ingrahamii 37]|uniref:Type IV pilus biogenesis protein PilO n=1 Tax=Psychromonas ingrahamii (strain DSM 17664 / CCUG 51855 / 37) TaxID=357804 RepID=A1SRB3_PSYIN|nr:type 4a pilus biogenesis protein PilO [Psychromonas ingrahamii]ABM02028.1 type IV pilus biogenesis protein PilO [Psychromonas ingrahamii 37]
MDLNDLDFETVGSWPALHRVVFIACVCAVLSGVFFYFITMPQINNLAKVEEKEIALKNEFKTKAALSSHLEEYRTQMVDIRLVFKGLLNRLPSSAEVASLLDDISFVGADNGLQFKSINWGIKTEGELSTEVPISIQVIGRYQDLGNFAADIAALPRIVILDNLTLTKGEQGLMTLNVIAKTYRYKESQK